jgi:hypothetical protein
MFGKKICEVCLSLFNLPFSIISRFPLAFATIQPFGDTYSALGIAAFKGHTSVATMLVEAGADVNYKIPTVLTTSQNMSSLPLVAAYFASQCLMVTLPWTQLTFCARVVFVDRMVSQRSCGHRLKDLRRRYKPWFKLEQM